MGRSGNLRYPNEAEFENGPIARRANFDSVGCMARAEDSKANTIPKRKGNLKRAGEGTSRRIGFAPVTKNYSI